jgi:hypothetical protein
MVYLSIFMDQAKSLLESYAIISPHLPVQMVEWMEQGDGSVSKLDMETYGFEIEHYDNSKYIHMHPILT